jgi:hypothetical protein
MKYLKSVVTMLGIVALCTLAACSRQDTPLTGRWINQSLPETVEFKNDHSGVFVVQGSPSLPFKWSLLNGNSVRIEIPYKGQSRSLAGIVERNTLTLNGREEQAVYVKME